MKPENIEEIRKVVGRFTTKPCEVIYEELPSEEKLECILIVKVGEYSRKFSHPKYGDESDYLTERVLMGDFYDGMTNFIGPYLARQPEYRYR